MSTKQHWENIYSTKPVDGVSWYQQHAGPSLALVRSSGVSLDAPIIDVGGGASVLVDELLDAGFSALTSLDVSAPAQAASRQRLGARADAVSWRTGNILDADLPAAGFELWHDRAVFHFLTDAADRQRYVDTLLHTLKPGGHLVIATFAEDGPTRCSNLPVQRYSPADLEAAFAPHFTLCESMRNEHATPFGTTQKFVYCRFRRS